jgi:hypothetical protein
MRLARFAVAGLALGIAAGFVAALLRPRPRTPGVSQSLTQATGEPIDWGARPEARPLSRNVPADPVSWTGPGPVAR